MSSKRTSKIMKSTMNMKAFLDEMKKGYYFTEINDSSANDITDQVRFLKYIKHLVTALPSKVFACDFKPLYTAIYHYSGMIKYPMFVLMYVDYHTLNAPLEQFFTNDLNVLLLIHETKYPLTDFMMIEKKIERHVFLELDFSTKRPGFITWYDAIVKIAIADKYGVIEAVQKPLSLKSHLCRYVDETLDFELKTRLVISTLVESSSLKEKVLRFWKNKDPNIERNIYNCENYFETKSSFRSVNLFFPYEHRHQGFINLKPEFFIDISFQKQFYFHEYVLNKILWMIQRDVKHFVTDFNTRKSLITLKPSPLFITPNNKLKTWLIPEEWYFVVKIIAEHHGLVFGESAWKVPEGTVLQEPELSIKVIINHLIQLCDQFHSEMVERKIDFKK